MLIQTAPYGTCSDLFDNESTFKEQPYKVRSQHDWFQPQLPVMAIFLHTHMVFWDRQDCLHELRVHAGMASSKSGRIGRTDQHTSRNAPWREGSRWSTNLRWRGRVERFFGTHMLTGCEPLCMGPWLCTLEQSALTPLPLQKFPSCLVIDLHKSPNVLGGAPYIMFENHMRSWPLLKNP